MSTCDHSTRGFNPSVRPPCFLNYVNDNYIPVVLPLMASSTQARYRGIINNYLLQAFGKLCLRDLETLPSYSVTSAQ